ncbi:sialidase [Carp edema virus]|nr:sialidase [Carp edema virus]
MIDVRVVAGLIALVLVGGVAAFFYYALTDVNFYSKAIKVPIVANFISSSVNASQVKYMNTQVLDEKSVIFDPNNLWGVNNDSKDMYRIPAGVISSTGRIFAVADYRIFGTGDHSNIDRCIAYSDDNGKTWKGHKIVLARETGSGRVTDGSITLAKLPNGKERIICMSSYYQFSDSWFNVREIGHNKSCFLMSYSDDDGKTWSMTKQLLTASEKASLGISTSVVCPGNGIQLKNGHIVISIHAITNLLHVRQRLFISKDYGKSWNVSNPAPAGDECQIVQSEEDGSIISICRPFRNSPATRHIYRTTDEGMTWEEYYNHETFEASICQGSFLKVRHRGIYYYCYSSPVGGSRNNRQLRVTKDFKTWKQLHTITNERCSGYSQLVYKEHLTKPVFGVIVEDYIADRSCILYQNLTPLLDKLPTLF